MTLTDMEVHLSGDDTNYTLVVLWCNRCNRWTDHEYRPHEVTRNTEGAITSECWTYISMDAKQSHILACHWDAAKTH